MNQFKVPPWMTTLCAVVLLGMLAHVPLMTANKGHTCPVLSAIHPTEAMASQATANSTVTVQGVTSHDVGCQNTAIVNFNDIDFGHCQFSLAYPTTITIQSVATATKKVATNLEWYQGYPAAHASGIAGNASFVNSTFTYYTGARDNYVDRVNAILATPKASNPTMVPEVANKTERVTTSATNLPAVTITDTDYGGTGATATWAAFSIENGYGGAQSGNHQNTTDVNIEMASATATNLPASTDIYDIT